MPTISEMIVSGRQESPDQEDRLLAPQNDPVFETRRREAPSTQGLSRQILEGRSPEQRLDTALRFGAQQTPERAGRILQVQERTRLPVDLIDRNLEDIETRLKREDFDVEAFRRNSPMVTEWISENPQHAALVQDEAEDVGLLENLVRGVGASVQRVEGGLRRTLFTATDPIADALERVVPLGRIAMEDGRLTWRRSTEEDLASPVGGSEEFVTATEGETFGYEPGTTWDDVKERPLTEFMPFALEQGIVSIPDMVVAALTPATYATSMTGQIGQARAVNDGRENATVGDLFASAPSAVAMGWMERLGARGMVGADDAITRLAQVPGAVGRSAGQEGATEFVQEGLQAATETIGTERGFNSAEALDQAIAGAVGGAGFGGSIRTITATTEAAVRTRQSRRIQEAIDALGDPERAPTMRQNAPGKYRELVDRITRDTPMENLYVDVGRFNEYFQSLDMDPRQAAGELLGDEIGRYDEALRTGGQVEIPTSRYAAADLEADAKQWLAFESTIDPNEMSAREWDDFMEQLGQGDPEAVEAALGAVQQENDSEAVYQDVLGQLIGVQPRDVAERNATLMASVFRTLGQRTGQTPKDLYRRYGLRVQREIPQTLRDVNDLDPLLDRLRTGEVPQQQDIFGDSLVEAIRRMGVRDDGGELADMDIDVGLRPFQRRAIRDDGRTLDDIAEFAVEAGYLPERDINQLLNAIDEEMRGRPTYVQGGENQSMLDLRQTLEDLDTYLTEIGVDVQNMDNSAIKELLEAGGPVVEPEGETELDQRRNDQRRGSIRFGGNRNFTITLFERADLSTFLHESGHFYLEVLGDLAQADDAPQQIRDDYQAILDWFGVSSRDEIGTDQHEQWARGFEAYLMEGSAPSPELRSLFARFWSWLVSIYRDVRVLDVDITPEIRGVMDRLVATDDEIEAARDAVAADPLFTDPAQADMTEEQFAEYQAAVERAREAARSDLTQQVMREKQREQKRWWRDSRETMREEVAAEVNQDPTFIALSVLQRGKLPDGSDLPDGIQPIKLSKVALVEQYGQAFLRRLPRPYVYSREGGVHPDTAAQIFGFETGRDLVMALANTEPRRRAIEQETDQRMRERYGDILMDGALPAEAMEAVHSDLRADLLVEEVRKLGSRAGRRAAPLDLVKQQAREIIDGKRVRDIKPIIYQRAEAKAARAAFNALAQGNYEAAFAEKQKQILNHELYRAARNAVQESERIARFMRQFNRNTVRGKVGLAGADYLAQIDSIMERFEFRRTSLKALDERQSLVEWIRAKEEAGETLGEEIILPDRLRDEAFRANYRELPFLELQGIYDTVRQIKHFADLKNRLLADKAQAEKDEARAELVSAAETNVGDRGPAPLSEASLTRREKMSSTAQAFDASLIKMEQVVEWLDGGDIDGPWHRFFFNGAAEAQAAEQDYTKRITEEISKAVMNIPKEIRRRMSDTVEASIPQRMTRRELIAIALNVGNESNYEKMVNGHGWPREQVDSWLKQLTQQEWDFIQHIWDTLESLWPDIAALQKELTGLEPDKVPPRQVETAFGTYRGGYYPVMYHPTASIQGEMQLSANIGGMLEGGFIRATTPKGHTKARIEGFARPFNLDVDALPMHIAGVVKDLTHRKWVVDANWIVNDSQVRESIRRGLGDAYVKMMTDWVKQVVNDRNFSNLRALGIWRRMMESLRFNFVVASMGFKATTMVSQLAGVGPSIEVIGGKELDGRKYFSKGLVRTLRQPRSAWQFVREASGEMRHRLNNKDRDIRDKMRALTGKDGLVPDIQRVALAGIGYADLMVTLPTWLGAYEKAKDQGLSEEVAIRAGDRAVRLSQGSGGAKDLSAVASRDSDLMRVLTMFYTPFSALYSRLRDIGHDFGSIRDVPQAAIRCWWVWLVPAVLGELMVARGPDEDDDESWPEWLAEISILYPTLAIPVLRDVAGAALTEYGYSFSPLAQAGNTTSTALSTTAKTIAGDAEWSDLAKRTFDASGYLMGLPTSQTEITGSYLYDLYTGDENPESPIEFIRNLLYRRED